MSKHTNYDTVMVKIENLETADYNPRSISRSALDKLKKGLEEYGCVQPIVANKATASASGKYTVVGGHQRIAAAKELGWTELPCQIINEPSVLREKALNLALNKVSGEWDFGKLGGLLSELADADFDIELTGFDGLEVKDLEGITSSLGEGFVGFEPARNTEAPSEFPAFDEDIHTDYRCPKCSYEWSGKAR